MFVIQTIDFLMVIIGLSCWSSGSCLSCYVVSVALPFEAFCPHAASTKIESNTSDVLKFSFLFYVAF